MPLRDCASGRVPYFKKEMVLIELIKSTFGDSFPGSQPWLGSGAVGRSTRIRFLHNLLEFFYFIDTFLCPPKEKAPRFSPALWPWHQGSERGDKPRKLN
jgi:hypothetical protein